MQKSWILIIMIFISLRGGAQEFNANVSVSAKEIAGTDRRVFDDLQSNLRSFINERRWTNIEFQSAERIDCSFLLNIKSKDGDTYRGDLSVVYTRPVFNSSYTSPVLNYLDEDLSFDYIEGQALDFQENSFSSNISSVISFYLYMILAIDFDTMGENGGAPYYEKASNILNAAQGSGDKGWVNSFGERNRATLHENFTNPAFADLHKFLYTYHRQGLDRMHKDKTKAKQNILKSLNFLKNIHDKDQNNFVLELIMNAKKDEFVNIFSEGAPAEKANALEALKTIDPAHVEDYKKIIRK